MNLGNFYNFYYSYILGIISKVVSDNKSIDPEDILQAFFEIKLMNGQIHEIMAQTTKTDRRFLTSSVKNFTIDQLRKYKTQKSQINKPTEINDETLAIKVTGDLSNTEYCQQIIDRLRSLVEGAKDREDVFELWYEGHSNSEIAEKLGLTTRQVEQQKYKIRTIAKTTIKY